MDDLKLYSKNPDQLKGLLHTVRTFTDDIQMKFCQWQALWTQFWGEGRQNGHHQPSGTGVTGQSIPRTEYPGDSLDYPRDSLDYPGDSLDYPAGYCSLGQSIRYQSILSVLI